jgi:hypothetical protein
MRVTTITVTRTIQVRQYEPLAVSATIELEPDDDPGPAATWVLGYVRAVLYTETQQLRADLAPRPPVLFDDLPI